MKIEFNKQNAPKILAFVALGLGILALFAGNINDKTNKTLSNKELALIVENKVDHISVDELADWIIQGKADYRLIDINEEKVFNEYHIPTAENMKITNLLDGNLAKNEKIIIYSEGGIHAAQAWMLLKANGFVNVYTLFGGLEEWKDRILFPSLPPNSSTADSINFEKVKAISKFFGGTPQETSGSTMAVTTTKKELPKLTPSTGGGTSAPPKKKKKEGC